MRNVTNSCSTNVLYNYSEGVQIAEGHWTNGPSMDGEGVFKYVQQPQAYGNKLS